jgi:hypothetical protein
MQKFNYFKSFTGANEFKTLDQLTAAEYEQIRNQAAELLTALKLKAKHGKKSIDETAFISSADSMHGFFFPSSALYDTNTNYKLLLIAFKPHYNYDFENHTRTETTPKPVAIFEDANENYFTLETYTPSTAPLEKWQNKLKDNIDDYNGKIEALKQITRQYKKDGKPFANIEKNFTNCSVLAHYDYNGNFLDYRVNYYYNTPARRYLSSTIYDTPAHPLKNIDDIMSAINATIKYYQQKIENTTQILNNSIEIYESVMMPYIENVLKWQTGTNNKNITIDYFEFAMREIIKDFYFHI